MSLPATAAKPLTRRIPCAATARAIRPARVSGQSTSPSSTLNVVKSS